MLYVCIENLYKSTMKTSIINEQSLVERLTQRMDLNRIFLFSHPYLEEERQHLLLVVNPVKGLAPKTMAPIVSLCLSDGEELSFDLVLAGEWQNQLRQGSLYYTYASLPQHELYAGSKKGNPLFSHKAITGLLELAELNYEKCRKGSDEFREGVTNFLTKDDYGQATFMLHQFLELRLKGFQATVVINSGKSHNVEHLMKGIRSVAPQLQAIFPYDSPSVELFRMLDQSYTKAKKQESVEITPDKFGILLDKCQCAVVEMDSMVATMVERIKAYRKQLPGEVQQPIEKQIIATKEEQLPLAASAKVTQTIYEDFSDFPWPERYKQDANTLLDAIRQKHNPEQITMLNYYSGGFSGNNLFQQNGHEEKQEAKIELYLVVLMKNKGPFDFRSLKVGLVSAMIVFMRIDSVEKKLVEGNRFVNTLWTKGRVLRRKSAFTPSFNAGEVDWKAEHERVSNSWENAKVCMGNLNGVIQNTAALTHDIGLLLLRNLMEIGVQTYLQCVVGSVPRQLGLAELIDWSGIADRTLLDFVYPAGRTATERMYFILNPERIWWHKETAGFSNLPPTFCREKSGEMFDFFERRCSEVLKELESSVVSYG